MVKIRFAKPSKLRWNERIDMKCPRCFSSNISKGRAMDGRRAYRCKACGNIWTDGLRGKVKQYSSQRPGYQFSDTGAARL